MGAVSVQNRMCEPVFTIFVCLLSAKNYCQPQDFVCLLYAYGVKKEADSD